MKKSIKLLTTSLLAVAAISPVHAELEGNVALTSDYVWRGVSQNAEDPAIQGGFDASHESGLYAGVWGSSVDFGSAQSTEIDLYLGWATEFTNGVGFDIGVLEYTYHGGDQTSISTDGTKIFIVEASADDADFTEYYLGLSYAGFGLTYFKGDEFDDNVELSYGYDFDKVSLSATYGDYDSYNYYIVGVSGNYGGLDLDLSYHDTDIDDLDEADGRAVLTVSKSF